MAYRVPFVEPARLYRMIQTEIDAAYYEVMSKGDLIMRGQLSSFERHLAEFVGTRYAVGLNSGYDALHISLVAAGIGPGDEVIVPAHTFLATASAAVNAGAKPVLVDVAGDFNIDVVRIEEAITPRTRAIIPVHLNGRMSDMDRVMDLARKHNLAVVEDACQSLGAALSGRKAGSTGLSGCWSFYPFKVLGGYGDGGAITTNDEKVARVATLLRYNGEDRDTGEYHYHGYTCLLDNLQAAFLDVKLRHLPDWIVRRKALAETYRQGLSAVGDLDLPHYDRPEYDDVYQNYVIRTDRRDALYEHLERNGVETLIHWRRPYYSYPVLKLEDRGFPVTEAISRESISLPMNVEMSDDQAEHVIRTVRSFFDAG